MPDLFLKKTSKTELRLAHSYLGGWILALIGLGLAWAGANLVDDGFGRWIMIVMGLIFALLGIGGGLWRYNLTIDLMARVYRGCRGFWPSPRRLQGSLSELQGVVLSRNWRRSDDTAHPLWVVSFRFRGWDKPVSVFETTNEAKGYRKLEELAELLHVSAIDHTGETEVVRGYSQLDRSVVDANRAPQSGLSFARSYELEQPLDSGIELGIGELGGRMIVLPAAGIHVGTVVLALFGLPFLGFGLLALASAVEVSPLEVSGTLSAKWIVGGVFTLLGLLMELGVIFGSVAREIIRDEGDAIVITLRAFGKHYRRRELKKHEIEEIAVKESRSSRAYRSNKKPAPTEVVLRTDRNVVRIAGDQPVKVQRWLAESLLLLVHRG